MLYKKIKPCIIEMMYFIAAVEYVRHTGEEERGGREKERQRDRETEMEEVFMLPPDSEHPLVHNTAINVHVNADPLNQGH